MNSLGKILLACAGVVLCLATGLGAYASHGLVGVLDARSLSSFATAVDYQFYHGLGLLAVGILLDRHPRARMLWIAGALFVVGLVLFCGSIYVTTLGGPTALGRAAPVGGIAFIAGWLALAVGAALLPRPPQEGPNAAGN
jgi:uncharacterized membrane protein YgdD (TMEM256/DUF423 family)